MEPQRAAAARSENFIVRKLGSYDSVVQYSGEQAILIGGRVAASKVEGRVVVCCVVQNFGSSLSLDGFPTWK